MEADPLGPADERKTRAVRLIRRAAEGDHGAYSEVVHLYRDALYSIALRILKRPADAEDAVQEAFIKAYVNLDRYDDNYSFYTWISAILTNVCYSALRARDWQVGPIPDQFARAMRVVGPRDDPETAALLRSRDEVLRVALESLPAKYSRVLLLRYWHDLSYQEVAATTQQSLGAVKTQIRRATLLLKEALDGRRAEFLPEGT